MIPSFNIAPGESRGSANMKRRLAQQMLASGVDTSPVQHWTQGLARMAQAFVGGRMAAQADEYESAAREQALKAQAARPTDDMREYNLAKDQGFTGSFLDYQTGLKRAGATQNSVMIDQKGESAFSTESGKLQAKRFDELAQDGAAAQQMISDLDTLRTLGAQIGTGKGAQVTAALGPYAQALGVDVKGLDEIQAYEAIVNRLAPNLRVKGSGPQSDYELRNFMKSLPSLGNQAGGNEIVTQTLQGLYRNKQLAAEIGSKALNGEISRSQAEKELRSLPDPMQGYRDFVGRTKPEAARNIRDIKAKYGLE